MDQKVVDAAREFAVNKLTSSLPPQISFHDFNHTQTVVSVSLEIGKSEGISENELRLLEIAAWFHDLGYPQQVEGHERIGASMAHEFLSEYNADPAEISVVEKIILSTEMKKSPDNLLEKIIRDADMAHLGMDNAKERSLFLKDEKEAMLGLKYSDEEWLQVNYDFYKDHRYNTKTAREKFGSKKKTYIDLMFKRLNRNNSVD